MHLHRNAGCLLTIFVFACEPGTQVLENTWEPFQLAAGQEEASKCMSWTLENGNDLFINSVEMTAGPGWHHSNWFFVPDDHAIGNGPDGIWNCNSRDFNTLNAATAGGVLFAQSTQVTNEVQQFKPGVAIPIPPRSRVVGQIHLLNTTNSPLDTFLKLSITSIAARDVKVRLAPMSFFFQTLAIPPNSRSEFTTACDFRNPHQSQLDRPIDFNLYYVMPHYHALGQGMTLKTFDENGDMDTVFESMSNIGEPIGAQIEPKHNLTGSHGLRFSCFFDNPRSESVGWGIGDQEMCVFLAFTDSELAFTGGNVSGPLRDLGLVNGYQRFEGDCSLVLGIPR